MTQRPEETKGRGRAMQTAYKGAETRDRYSLRLPRTVLPWVLVFGLIAMTQVLTLLAMPIIYDTIHLSDTLFLLNEGWRVSLGLRPGVDFESFYPGLAARFIALSFALIGPSARALDVAPLLQFAVLLPLAVVVLHRRSEPISLMSGVALIATCLLTRAPIEEYVALTHMVSAHSFSYNRLGLACSLVAVFLVLLPARSGHVGETLAGAAGGIALALALMSKWSFALLLPIVLVTLALQKRPAAFAGLLTGTLLCWMSLDPFGAQFFGSAAYMQAAANAEDGFGGISGVFFKAQRMMLSHLWVLLALGVVLVVVFRALPAGARWIWLGSVALLSLAIGANLIVMGPFGLTGHQILPAGAAIAIVCFEQIRDRNVDRAGTLKFLAGLLLFSFLLPHLVNSLLVTAAGYKNRPLVLMSEGPMGGYLHRYAVGTSPENREQIFIRAASMVANQGRVTRDTEYPVFVDGVLALRSLGDLSNTGIVSDGLYSFEFALGARPVTGYPLWPRLSSPDITDTDQIPEDADIVMILRLSDSAFGNLLRERMGNDFRSCKTSEIWEIFVRRDGVVHDCGWP